MSSIIESLRNGTLDSDVLRSALLAEGDAQDELFALARERRDEAFPDQAVEMRSVTEISNICLQRCRYCAIGGGSGERNYTISKQDFLELVAGVHGRGRRVLLMQSGENDAQHFVDHVAECVAETTSRYPDMRLILCLGNMSPAQYQQLRDAGSDRYILKFETSNPELYAQLKPRDTLENRLNCLQSLIDLGFQVGSGNMVGLPGQTIDDMVKDVQLLGAFDLAMSSCTPFIPGEGSQLHDAQPGDVNLAFNTMALIRILYPDRLIPTTSSLERALPGGQLKGLMAGANTVTVHDATPDERREDFPIYSSHRFTPHEEHLMKIVEAAHLKPAVGALK